MDKTFYVPVCNVGAVYAVRWSFVSACTQALSCLSSVIDSSSSKTALIDECLPNKQKTYIILYLR